MDIPAGQFLDTLFLLAEGRESNFLIHDLG